MDASNAARYAGVMDWSSILRIVAEVIALIAAAVGGHAVGRRRD